MLNNNSKIWHRPSFTLKTILMCDSNNVGHGNLTYNCRIMFVYFRPTTTEQIKNRYREIEKTLNEQERKEKSRYYH